jgi:hypothetical protein
MKRLMERVGFRVMGIETAAYYHTLHNILASIDLRGGLTGRLSHVALAAMGEPVSRRLGLWINLGDTMFVAAAPTAASKHDLSMNGRLGDDSIAAADGLEIGAPRGIANVAEHPHSRSENSVDHSIRHRNVDRRERGVVGHIELDFEPVFLH